MNDGDFIIYRVQHFEESHRRCWVDSALDHMLFEGMSYEDKCGTKGDAYRSILHPQHDCWQRTGLDGFLVRENAYRALEAVERERPTHRFRIACVRLSKATEPLPPTAISDVRRRVIKAIREAIDRELRMDPLAKNHGVSADGAARVLAAYEEAQSEAVAA